MNNTAARVITTVLCLVTIAAILVGLYIHVFSRKISFKKTAMTSGQNDYDEAVEEIKIDVDAANIVIEEGDKFSVEYNLPENAEPVVEFKNGVYSFKSKMSMHLAPFDIGNDMKVEVTVPEGTDLKSIFLELDAGNVSLEGLKTDKIRIESKAGNIEMDEMKTDTLEIESNAGNITISDLKTDKAKLEIDAGNIEIKDSEIDNIEASTDAGNVTVNDSTVNSGMCRTDFGNVELTGKIGEGVRAKTSVGNATINGR